MGAVAIARIFCAYATDYYGIFADSSLLDRRPAILLFFFRKQFVQPVAYSGLQE